MVTTHIRPITNADVEALQRISVTTFIDTFAADNSDEEMRRYVEENLSVEQLSHELANPESYFYFADGGGEPIGYLKLNVGAAQTENTDADAMEIERIYVLKEHHGSGVGQELLHYALDQAREHHASYMWLGVWEHNQRALRFYEKHSFVPFDKHIFMLGSEEQTDIMMKRELELP